MRPMRTNERTNEDTHQSQSVKPECSQSEPECEPECGHPPSPLLCDTCGELYRTVVSCGHMAAIKPLESLRDGQIGEAARARRCGKPPCRGRCSSSCDLGRVGGCPALRSVAERDGGCPALRALRKMVGVQRCAALRSVAQRCEPSGDPCPVGSRDSCEKAIKRS